MITRAMYGTRLKTRIKILYNPMKEHNKALNASLEIEKNLLFIRKEKSPNKIQAREDKISNPVFIIVHHMKNALTAVISIIILLLRASN
jgi:hypothetical protein